MLTQIWIVYSHTNDSLCFLCYLLLGLLSMKTESLIFAVQH